MSAIALVDSNALIAIVATEHQHHEASLRFGALFQRARFAVADHSFAGAYNTLTRAGPQGPARFTPDEAIAVLEDLHRRVDLLGLRPSQVFDGLRRYALAGGVGPRLNDKSIGDVAVFHGIGTIATWNRNHMIGLFPTLTVKTPSDMVAGI